VRETGGDTGRRLELNVEAEAGMGEVGPVMEASRRHMVAGMWPEACARQGQKRNTTSSAVPLPPTGMPLQQVTGSYQVSLPKPKQLIIYGLHPVSHTMIS
jgi:hypothetical protein